MKTTVSPDLVTVVTFALQAVKAAVWPDLTTSMNFLSEEIFLYQMVLQFLVWEAWRRYFIHVRIVRSPFWGCDMIRDAQTCSQLGLYVLNQLCQSQVFVAFVIEICLTLKNFLS